MCAEKNKYIRMPQQHKHKHREARQDLKHQMKRKRGVSLSSISSTEISDDLILDNGFEYDNISSGSLGSYTDDEIESLMKSTRKRMRDLDDDWTLFPRQHPPSPVSKTFDNTDVSINSLDTLVLEADDSKEYLDVYDLKNEAYSPTMSPEDSKYESLITNNNNIILEFKDTENLYKNHVQSDNVIDDKVIKKEEMGDFEYNYIPCYSAVNVNNNSIKQELCGDL
ncbi:uncharacterized protein LOC124538653 isoform X2 [Vanessa cardui]|nr:uncharacterized protein LOC124538653 isoform X2 [Vanessa cardui]